MSRLVFSLDCLMSTFVLCHRCTTSCLLCYLTSAYPEWALAFQFLITLDFSSHYMHMNRYVMLYGMRSLLYTRVW